MQTLQNFYHLCSLIEVGGCRAGGRGEGGGGSGSRITTDGLRTGGLGARGGGLSTRITDLRTGVFFRLVLVLAAVAES